jgi:hypothetical protein
MGYLITPLGNHGSYPMIAQPLTNPAMTVSAISGQLLRPPSQPMRAMDAHRIEHRFGVQGLAGLPGAELDR